MAFSLDGVAVAVGANVQLERVKWVVVHGKG
jgi:hypothetical protein